jgi:hypothetical protein
VFDGSRYVSFSTIYHNGVNFAKNCNRSCFRIIKTTNLLISDEEEEEDEDDDYDEEEEEEE